MFKDGIRRDVQAGALGVFCSLREFLPTTTLNWTTSICGQV